MIPDTPPAVGSPQITLLGSNGTEYAWRTYGDDHWIVTDRNHIQTEIRRLPGTASGFSFLRTDGKNSQQLFFDRWSDMATYF